MGPPPAPNPTPVRQGAGLIYPYPLPQTWPKTAGRELDTQQAPTTLDLHVNGDAGNPTAQARPIGLTGAPGMCGRIQPREFLLERVTDRGRISESRHPLRTETGLSPKP